MSMFIALFVIFEWTIGCVQLRCLPFIASMLNHKTSFQETRTKPKPRFFAKNLSKPTVHKNFETATTLTECE